MLRYSRDLDSAVRSGIDFFVFLARRLNMDIIAGIVEREKAELLADTNKDPLKEADIKSLCQYCHVQLVMANYNLTALVFENHIVDKLGELDDIRFKTLEEKRAAEKAEGERILESLDKAKSEEEVKVFLPGGEND